MAQDHKSWAFPFAVLRILRLTHCCRCYSFYVLLWSMNNFSTLGFTFFLDPGCLPPISLHYHLSCLVKMFPRALLGGPLLLLAPKAGHSVPLWVNWVFFAIHAEHWGRGRGKKTLWRKELVSVLSLVQTGLCFTLPFSVCASNQTLPFSQLNHVSQSAPTLFTNRTLTTFT